MYNAIKNNYLFALMCGSTISGLTNLFVLTFIAVNFSLNNLDIFYLSRETNESILKLLFISQIGYVFISFRQKKITIKKKMLIWVFLGVFISLTFLIFWNFHIEKYVGPLIYSDNVYNSILYNKLKIPIIIFCVFYWVDSLITPVLVKEKLIYAVYGTQVFSNVVQLVLLLFYLNSSIVDLSYSFAVNKVVSVVFKLTVFLYSDHKIISSKILNKDSQNLNWLVYIFPNIFSQFNRVFYVFSVGLLQPGLFALYYIYYKYYTALQSVVTGSILNKNLAVMSRDKACVYLPKILELHYLSCYALIILVHIAVLSLHFINKYVVLPEYLSHEMTLITIYSLAINFFFDGLNFLLSKYFLMNKNSGFDAKIITSHQFFNIVLYYLFIVNYGYLGLIISSILNCLLFLLIRIRFLESSSSNIDCRKIIFEVFSWVAHSVVLMVLLYDSNVVSLFLFMLSWSILVKRLIKYSTKISVLSA